MEKDVPQPQMDKEALAEVARGMKQRVAEREWYGMNPSPPLWPQKYGSGTVAGGWTGMVKSISFGTSASATQTLSIAP